MKKAILGKKLGMTQRFLEDGRLVPVTAFCWPCTVVQKTLERDGYEAVQLSFDELPETVPKTGEQADAGHFARAGALARYLREFRLQDSASYEVGRRYRPMCCRRRSH